MLVKFFRRGTGVGSGPIDYLLGRNRDREDARVLYGDPIITEQLINATPYKQKYKAGVLSFEEQAEQLSEAQKQQIMQGFEKTLFVGLEPDQYDILWVEHTDKGGRLELNFVIPGQELRSGKRLQPFYAKADLVRVNAYKNMINHQYGLSSPDEPERKRLVNPYTDNAPRPSPFDLSPTLGQPQDKAQDEAIIKDPPNRQALKDAINRRMLMALMDQHINNRQTVVRFLEKLGLQIKRQTKQSISVAHPKMATNIRLKGGLYQEEFSRYQSTPRVIERLQMEYEEMKRTRAQQDEKTWRKGLEIKEAYHKALYGDISPTEPSFDVKATQAPKSNIDASESVSEPFKPPLTADQTVDIDHNDNKPPPPPSPSMGLGF